MTVIDSCVDARIKGITSNRGVTPAASVAAEFIQTSKYNFAFSTDVEFTVVLVVPFKSCNKDLIKININCAGMKCEGGGLNHMDESSVSARHD